jgi:hypothetical protein
MLPVDPGSESPTAPTVPFAHSVTLYLAKGCHLCERALEVVQAVRARTPFTLELVDIGGVAALEAEYREHLPVIEIDGVRAFTYFVTVDALLDRLAG